MQGLFPQAENPSNPRPRRQSPMQEMRLALFQNNKEKIKMVSAFTIYDLLFLAAFTIAVSVFLYTRRKNLQRQGLLYLYRTQVGVRFIDKFSKKYSRLLHSLQYLIITSGFLLMAGMIWMLIRFSWFYLTSPVAAKALKVPVLIPLVPYLPDIFKIDFLPSFNFTYWIIIIALIAIPHEFAHGIFARLYQIKVHSTGFGFLGPFLAAFVEPDEKSMAKLKKSQQMTILAAGTFANVIFFIIFALLFWLFFAIAFTPAGVNFNTYSTSIINTSSISLPSNFSLDEEFIEINSNGQKYFTNPKLLQQTLDSGIEQLIVFDDSPALNASLQGAIAEINGIKVTSFDELRSTLASFNPGEEVEIKTFYQESVRSNNIEERSYTLQLAERDGKSFLGIGIASQQSNGLLGYIFTSISKIKDPFIFYQSSLGTFGWFVYYLLWWSVLILISVALVNMLPLGIFDGGRFFYLAVWGLTGSEKIGRKSFSLSTWLLLALLLALMIKWALIFI